jgi:ferredoxin-NADP reductase/Na+-translocating ferredoxin:NAD+ oxidoreductase RnfD subunit
MVWNLYQRIIDQLDKLLDSLTTYRLVLYTLCAYAGWGIFLGLTNHVPFTATSIVVSMTVLVVAALATNLALARFLDIPKNKDSDLITALILSLILSPTTSINGLLILAIAAIAAMASKYILVISRKHIFNPAAFGAVIVGLILGHYASWWVGTAAFLPLTAVGAILITHKMKRFSMMLLFLIVSLIILSMNLGSSSSISHTVWLGLSASPMVFFASIMLTEPLTSPLKRSHYLVYSGLVAVLYSISRFGFSPEEALLIGNLLTYVMAPARRLKLEFIEHVEDAREIHSYVFKRDKNFHYRSGQYMEWTIPARKSDSRGNRRYLTIASSPTEDQLRFTLKQPAKASSFKTRLEAFKPGDYILASQLAGDFVLPENKAKPVALIAGGVGITPFRSMAKYLLDRKERRPVGLLYNVNDPAEFAFTDLFKKAEAVGLKTHYSVSDATKVPVKWNGFSGFIDTKTIQAAFPDYKQRTFYLSGPHAFVQAVRQHLISLGVNHRQIISDFFPGYS